MQACGHRQDCRRGYERCQFPPAAVGPTGGQKPLSRTGRRQGQVGYVRCAAAGSLCCRSGRGAQSDYVELPEDAICEALGELASRRDQLKQMMHTETWRLGTVRLSELRQAIATHLEALKAEDKQIHKMKLPLVCQRKPDQHLLGAVIHLLMTDASETLEKPSARDAAPRRGRGRDRPPQERSDAQQ